MDVTDLLSDIAQFADPFTDVKLRAVAGGAKIDLVRNGKEMAFQVDAASGRVTAKHHRKIFATVNSLLASEEFANLARFAETVKRSAAKRSKGVEIPAKIICDKRQVDATGLLAALPDPKNRTSIVLLDGPAGVGKTFQIEKIALKQAELFIQGQATPPVLHVSSKGRRLSSLIDVLALATQDMAAQFTARHVPTLVRRGLLVVAIDGFDELVDTDGYEDSWSALRQFLSEVGSSGVIILAARDTFVEEQELLHRIDRSRAEVSLSLAHVQLTSAQDAKEWLSKAPNWKASELDSDIASDLLAHGSYALRPFFLRQLWEAKGWNEIADVGPRSYLVNKLVRREAILIAQQVGKVSADALTPVLMNLLGEVALEMAGRETDAVEVEHLAFVTQFFFEGVLDDASIQKLTHKAGSMALLETTEGKQRRKFPHSEIESYFLGLELFKSLNQHNVPSALRKAILGNEQLEVFSEVMASVSGVKETVLPYLTSVRASEIASDHFDYNSASLLLLAFAMGMTDLVEGVEAIEATLVGASPKGRVTNCRINRLDVSGANLTDVEFEGTRVDTLVVDDATRFGKSIPGLLELEFRGENEKFVEKNEIAIRGLIESKFSGESSDEIESNAATKLLDRVARRSVRHFYLKEGDGDESSSLLRDPEWEKVRRVLSKHERLEIHRGKSMGGRPSPLIRIKQPRELLDRDNRLTKKIFAELGGL